MESEKQLILRTNFVREALQNDVLLYGVSDAIDKLLTSEKRKALSNFTIDDVLTAGSLVSSFSEILNSSELIVVIPGQLKDLLKSGEAVFDKSKLFAGQFTPNFRIKGGKGISGQITLKRGVSKEVVSNRLTNLLSMALSLQALSKLKRIEQKLDEIKQGQMNDRIGRVVGAFKEYCDSYESFNSEVELRNHAHHVLIEMHQGLEQILLEIKEERKQLDKAPDGIWAQIVNRIKLGHRIDYFSEIYDNYAIHLNIYSRLVFLYSIVRATIGNHVRLSENFKTLDTYLSDFHSISFLKRMKYVLNREPEELLKLSELSKNLNRRLIDLPSQTFALELSKSDITNLQLCHESEND